MLQAEVYYERRTPSSTREALVTVDAATLTGTTFEPLSPLSLAGTGVDLYVRSEYAPAYGLEISKTYRNLTATTLHAGDRIAVEITLKNTTPRPIDSITYLDTIPAIFSLPSDAWYRLLLGSGSSEHPIEELSAEDYSVALRGERIPSGQTLTLSYELEAASMRYGDMIVDRLEG
jgi:hypothetical protein